MWKFLCVGVFKVELLAVKVKSFISLFFTAKSEVKKKKKKRGHGHNFDFLNPPRNKRGSNHVGPTISMSVDFEQQ